MTRCHYLPAFVCVLVSITFGNMARAALIPNAIGGVKGWAFQRGDNVDPLDGSISRALDGSGVTVGNPLNSSTWTHDITWQNNWQGNGPYSTSHPSTPGAWFVADLQRVYGLDKLYFWNVREGSALDRGTNNMHIYYAISPTSMPATNSAYNFASGGWTLLGNYTIPKAPGGATGPDQIIDLTAITVARYIGFALNSNYDSAFRIGFAEVQFTPTPEPSTLVLGVFGMSGIGIYFWRRRRREVVAANWQQVEVCATSAHGSG